MSVCLSVCVYVCLSVLTRNSKTMIDLIFVHKVGRSSKMILIWTETFIEIGPVLLRVSLSCCIEIGPVLLRVSLSCCIEIGPVLLRV